VTIRHRECGRNTQLEKAPMNSFDYYDPVRVHFGPIAKGLGKRVCLVSYRDMTYVESLCNKIVNHLKAENLAVFPFFEAEPNSDILVIVQGSEFCRERNIDLVIGVGGGSAMDAAKAVAAGVFYTDDFWNMVYSRHDNVHTAPPSKGVPILMIPTLPATGSEMNQSAVVSNSNLKEKSYIWSECFYPVASIIDPELTLTLPPFQTACAAADSISHVLELYINGEANSPLQHSFQVGVMRTVLDNVRVVLKNPENIDARSNLQWDATCAINGWASPGDAWTPIHQVAHNLTSLFGVAHGASLSALIPAWMKSFYKRRTKRYLYFALNVMKIRPDVKFEDEIMLEGINTFENILIEIGVPVLLKELRISADKLDSILDGVKKVCFNDNGMLTCNPPVLAEDIISRLNVANPA